jgi:hypothetical protein
MMLSPWLTVAKITIIRRCCPRGGSADGGGLHYWTKMSPAKAFTVSLELPVDRHATPTCEGGAANQDSFRLLSGDDAFLLITL